jgi:hypothetical protein
LLELEESGFAALHAGRVTIDQGRGPDSTLLDLAPGRGLWRQRLAADAWLLVVAREGIREAAMERLRARGILVRERAWLRLIGLEPRYRVQDPKPGETTMARLRAATREGSDGSSQVVVRLARLLAAAGCPGMAVERVQVHAEPEDEIVKAVREAAARAQAEIRAMLVGTPAAGVASGGLAGLDQTVLRGWGQHGPLNRSRR